MAASIVLPDQIPVMPLPGALLFPRALLPLYIFEPRYRAMLEYALKHHRMFSVALIKPVHADWQSPDDFFEIAGVGLIRACVGRGDGTSNLILQGLERVRSARHQSRRTLLGIEGRWKKTACKSRSISFRPWRPRTSRRPCGFHLHHRPVAKAACARGAVGEQTIAADDSLSARRKGKRRCLTNHVNPFPVQGFSAFFRGREYLLDKERFRDQNFRPGPRPPRSWPVLALLRPSESHRRSVPPPHTPPPAFRQRSGFCHR
jgi:hypothetical protein